MTDQLVDMPYSTPTPANSPATEKEQIVTEIYADKAIFESTKSIGVFTGHIVVIDPRFQIQGDKLTIYFAKGQGEGLEKAVVEGNVGVVRDRPDPAVYFERSSFAACIIRSTRR